MLHTEQGKAACQQAAMYNLIAGMNTLHGQGGGTYNDEDVILAAAVALLVLALGLTGHKPPGMRRKEHFPRRAMIPSKADTRSPWVS